MTISTQTLLWHCKTTLQDAGATRWTLDELRRYLNQGLKVIAVAKPTAVSKTIVMALQEGTYQELADGQTLLNVIRNITSAVDATPRIGGRIVTPITATALNSSYPDWHTQAKQPFSATVTHVVTDMTDTGAFYVFPGNTGTGKLEITVAQVPADIPAPGNVLDESAYTTDIDLDALYEPVLMDFILFRAFSKDSDKQASAARAQAHYASFQSALGIKKQGEAETGVAGRTAGV